MGGGERERERMLLSVLRSSVESHGKQSYYSTEETVFKPLYLCAAKCLCHHHRQFWGPQFLFKKLEMWALLSSKALVN